MPRKYRFCDKNRQKVIFCLAVEAGHYTVETKHAPKYMYNLNENYLQRRKTDINKLFIRKNGIQLKKYKLGTLAKRILWTQYFSCIVIMF